MADFMEFIFGNLFFFIIIIGAIINVLNSNKKKKQKQAKRNPTRSNDEKSPNDWTGKLEDFFDTILEEDETENTLGKIDEIEEDLVSNTQAKMEENMASSVDTIEEQRQKQYERLRAEIQNVSENDDSSFSQRLKENHTTNDQKVVLNFQKQWTKDKFVEGIIMSEVLGPPRALKKYENNISKRRMN